MNRANSGTICFPCSIYMLYIFFKCFQELLMYRNHCRIVERCGDGLLYRRCLQP
uniref:Uncharacterized protein n=1 Tax=Anguilla anguilla TaxID=7936 RepID=A0A0E9SHS6_ANGAN